ncbi:hypothetical protein E3E38_09345 [Thermococcus sp. 18S1]|uniref:hypothetical protein n=1 Tax=Thermococcus sp. 18S1 TaxID=1638210 RepID=UPI001439AA8C|nr:hypothetical protein [Thermococcus sp. 18S1]NJE31245.1 hypothetical protein [Thermococcus sp. 18S1]
MPVLGRTGRKAISAVLLSIPAIVMFLENASIMEVTGTFNWLPNDVAYHVLEVQNWVEGHIRPLMFSPLNYAVFSIASLGVFIISFILALLAGWRLRGSGRNSLGVFFSTFLSRYFIGELAVSGYGLFIFVLFAIILTAWLPDALEMGNPWFISGTILYFLSIIFATAFAYPAPKEVGREEHPKTRHLVYGLSYPGSWGLIEGADCETMRRNRKVNADGKEVQVSLLPLYVSMHYHLTGGPLEHLHLLVTREAHLESIDPPKLRKNVKELLRTFFGKASECLKVSFVVRWPGETPEEISAGNVTPERKVQVEFVPIRDSNNVREIFKDIGNSRVAQLIDENSGDITFHLTGGTAPMSIAMMLHAIKGDTHAEYARQRVFDVEPEKLLLPVDMDVFDLEDLVRELREYFERRYERG